MSPWSEWNLCSASDCGETGVKTRTRTCIAPQNGGTPCSGDKTETVECTKDCPSAVALWSDWSSCTVSCGGGSQERSRTCTGSCTGVKTTESQTCNASPCPSDFTYTNWGQWSACSLSCGVGQRSRTRSCIDGQNGGSLCPASPDISQSENCNIQLCPVDFQLTEWGAWSDCSVTCSNGVQSRTRMCTPPQHGGTSCPSDVTLSEEQQCTEPACPIDGNFLQWGTWSECSSSCGDGTQEKHRDCTEPQNGGSPCLESGKTQTQVCTGTMCPTDAVMSEWSDWGSCSQTCGGGSQARLRLCTSPAQHGGTPCGDLEESRSCNPEVCTSVTDWQAWESCDVTCGGGTTTRTRSCSGDCTGIDLQQTETCNPDPCPIDGVLLEWSPWSACSVTCGEGQTKRTRTCADELHGGLSCKSASLEEVKSCSLSGCAPAGVLTSWSEWVCSVTCGAGTASRSRTCSVANGCGDSLLAESQACEKSLCPVDGTLSNWTEWICSSTCGSGTRTRTRNCVGAVNGGLECPGEDLEQTDDCPDLDPCPVDGVLSEWGEWLCSTNCGEGTETRTRTCDGAAHGGANCPGAVLLQSQPCSNLPPCTGTPSGWSEWVCSVTCGSGQATRSRFCQGSQGSQCPDVQLTETKECGLLSCPIDGTVGPWTSWSTCSQICGLGQRTRTRVCNPPSNGGQPCSSTSQSAHCNNGDCQVTFNPWGSWSTCSHTCGLTGTRNRIRTCQGQPGCKGQQEDESKACNRYACLWSFVAKAGLNASLINPVNHYLASLQNHTLCHS